MFSHLNVDQWVMARDRHRLNRLRKGKDANEKQYQELQICIINEPDNVLWGLVEMIGNALER